MQSRNSIFQCTVCICIIFIFCNCNRHLSTPNNVDCLSSISNNKKPFDASKSINEYLDEVSTYVLNLKEHSINKEYSNCSKADILKYYLDEHAMIDSVIISESGHSISFYRKTDKVWDNILIE
jgi:hypothetical protein